MSSEPADLIAIVDLLRLVLLEGPLLKHVLVNWETVQKHIIQVILEWDLETVADKKLQNFHLIALKTLCNFYAL